MYKDSTISPGPTGVIAHSRCQMDICSMNPLVRK